jgi:hypothetical protein
MTIYIPQSLFDKMQQDDNRLFGFDKMTLVGPYGTYTIEPIPDIKFTKVTRKGKTIMVKQVINEIREYK